MSTHTGVKPYQNSKIDKILSDNTNIISHLGTPTGVPPFLRCLLVGPYLQLSWRDGQVSLMIIY